MNDRLSITDVAKYIGVTARTGEGSYTPGIKGGRLEQEEGSDKIRCKQNNLI